MRFWLFYKYDDCIHKESCRTIIRQDIRTEYFRTEYLRAESMTGAPHSVGWVVRQPPYILSEMVIKRKL